MILPLTIDDLLIHSLWVIRLIISALCGCLIGYERSNRNKGAGVRTHAILALGSGLIMLLSKYGFLDINEIDGSRVAAQIVSGVGFLGAGVIFVKNGNISGLTTAAGLWATSGVGMCIGAGMYDMGIVATLLLIGLQILFHRGFFLKLTQNSQTVHMEIYYEECALKDIQSVFKKCGIDIYSMKIENLKNKYMYIELEISFNQNFEKEYLLSEMMKKSYLKKIKYC